MARCEHYRYRSWQEAGVGELVRCPKRARYIARDIHGTVSYRCEQHKDENDPVTVFPLREDDTD